MKILGIWIFTFLFGVIAVGCAAGPTLTPVTDPTQRLQFQGFSILPPRGENWEMDTSPQIYQGWTQTVIFYKRLSERIERPEDAHTIFASVRTRSLGTVRFENRTELFQYLARTWGKGKIDPRHRLLDSKVILDRCMGFDCVRYGFKAEDRGVPQFPGSVFVTDIHGFLFYHPELPSYLIDVAHSRRYLQGGQPFPVETELQPFIMSLVFTPMHAMQSPSEDVVGYLVRGNISMEKEQYNQAISDFTKALEIDPRFAEAYLQRGFVLDRLRDYPGALKDFEKALEYESDPSKKNYIAWLIQNTKFVMGK